MFKILEFVKKIGNVKVRCMVTMTARRETNLPTITGTNHNLLIKVVHHESKT